MKEVVLIVRPEKLEPLKALLDNLGCGGMTIESVMGCGTQRGFDEPAISVIKGLKTNINLLPKIKVSVVVRDSVVEEIVTEVRDKIATERVGDGKIFIRPIEDAIRIRTGERGKKAIN